MPVRRSQEAKAEAKHPIRMLSRMVGQVRSEWNTLLPYMEQIAALAELKAVVSVIGQKQGKNSEKSREQCREETLLFRSR